MSSIPASLHGSNPAKTAVWWVELSERLKVCGRRFRDLLRGHLHRHQLGEAEFSILWVCRGAPPAGFSQRDLAAALAVSPAAVSGLVERLRSRRLLEGRRAESDRRRQLWRLTPTGKSTLDAVLVDLTDWAAALRRQLGPAGSSELFRLAEELAGALVSRCRAESSSRPVLEPFVAESAGRDDRDDTVCREGAA